MRRQTLRMQSVQTPIIPVVGELIRENPGVISLGQGVVNYGPPPEVVNQIKTFLADPNNHKYALVQGIPALLEQIKIKLVAENGISVNADSAVMVTAGSNMAFMNAILTITEPGDEIILQTPYYFNHEMAIAIADCNAVSVLTDDNYQLQLDAIEAAVTPKTKAVVTISPNNPTGAVYTEESLRAVNKFCRERGLYHIHDQAYEYFTYGGVKSFSPGSIEGSAKYTISLFSLSKAYGFASWRIGYMVAPDHLYESLRKVQDTNLICPPAISQWAAVGALEAGRDYCMPYVEELGEVRKMTLEKLNHLRNFVTVPTPYGAFYCLLRVKTDLNAMTIVERLIREYKVAVIPGFTFGLEEGCSLRVAYGAMEKHTVLDGMDRLVSGLRDICAGS
ncbi:MAG: pyridoxal phosphate-dependent aminotransferase [Cyclobacteriaceae bacterium]|nr:pyridoxal phosphate-dependent aminotransferase [Cyclobacteriaceae bacterium]